MAHADYSLLVAPGIWDDIGNVLKGLGYKYETNELDSLSDPSRLKGCRVIFVSCGASLSGNKRVAETLREFVAHSGAMYVSDLSYEVINQLFPGKVQFNMADYSSHITGEIVDPGLMEIVGKSVKLHMDFTSAAGIESISEGVNILIEGQRKSKCNIKYPLLLTFNHGAGQVIYTVFHNSKQVSHTEKKLLNYLIFRPIMSGAATRAAQLVQAQMAVPGKEIFASISPGETSSRYGINVTLPITILFVLSWEENAIMELHVWDPSGKLVKDTSINKSPVTIEIPASQQGTWTCSIKGQVLPHRNFPYVLTIATKGGTAVPVKSVTPIASSSAVSASRLAKYLPIYLIVDGSSKANDVLNPLTIGLRQFSDRLRARSFRDYSACISLLLANDTGQVIVPLIEATRYSVPTLDNRGRCGLGKALNNLLTGISSDPANIKPLIFLLLASAPDDDWMGRAEQLHNMVTQGKANGFVIGLGGYADKNVFKKLLPTPPMALPIVTQVYSQQLFDWFYSLTDMILNGLESGGSGQHKNVPPPPACVRLIT
jgi:uncharacterized protein YegL